MNNNSQEIPHQITVRQVLHAVNEIAPPELAEVWDHIGLQAGYPSAAVRRVLLALDVTPRVLAEAVEQGCEVIISHHPLIFEPLPALSSAVPEQSLVMELVRNKISLIVAHTNLDVAAGGVADCLADCLLAALPAAPAHQQSPYPVVAKYGRLVQQTPRLSMSGLLPLIRQCLGSAGCRINSDEDRLVGSMAVFPGSFPEEAIPEIQASQVELVVCGEIKHHVGLMLNARGIAVIDAGHDVTERVALQPLADRLAAQLPQIQFAVARYMHYNEVAF